MSRDHTKLRIFRLADELTIEVYKATGGFPAAEKYGLQSQVRRAAVSVTSNIVEGSARRTTRDYLQFMNLATGSAAETLYLLGLARRLGTLPPEAYRQLESKYNQLLRGLQKLIRTLESQP